MSVTYNGLPLHKEHRVAGINLRSRDHLHLHVCDRARCGWQDACRALGPAQRRMGKGTRLLLQRKLPQMLCCATM